MGVRVTVKPSSYQQAPSVPNFDDEAAAVVEYNGLPPLEPRKKISGQVLFTNVSAFFSRQGDEISKISLTEARQARIVVLVKNGHVQCVGTKSSCPVSSDDLDMVDLKGGTVSPGLISFGSPLGTTQILAEESTNDSEGPDPFAKKVPSVLGSHGMVRAVDGLQFGGRDAL